jgi:hypothetical protein
MVEGELGWRFRWKMFGKVGENFPMEREKQDCYIRRDDSTVREFERDTMTVT